MRISGLIVAAGKDEKEQNYKQMAKNRELSPAERVVLNFQRAGIKDIVMITGYQAKELEKSLKHYSVTFMRNENYLTTKMFDSVKIGLDFLRDKCDQILLCPSDIPFIQDETMEAILKAEGKLIYPICNGQTGHPIRLDTDLVKAVLQYKGERGLQGALESLPVEPVRLQINDEGVITDSDRNEYYEHLIKRHDSALFRPEIKVRLANKSPFFGPGRLSS